MVKGVSVVPLYLMPCLLHPVLLALQSLTLITMGALVLCFPPNDGTRVMMKFFLRKRLNKLGHKTYSQKHGTR
jgi:hypothetical protein